MEPVLIFRHVAIEGPGYFAEFLSRHGTPYRVIAVDEGEGAPTDLQGISALVFMGGPMSANDPLPWVEAELRLIRQAAAAAMPVLGHCLGGQLIARALGGQVSRNPVREIGWHPVQRLANAAAREWLADLPQELDCFHWHGETFSIPPGATPILRSEHCAHQGFVRDNILALQCHVEMTADLVREWAQSYRDELSAPSPSVQDAEQMTEHLLPRIAALKQAADTLYARWLQPLMKMATP